MPDGTTAYTRDGSFQLSAQGQMVTSSGYVLQPGITIPDGSQSVTIGRDGVVSVRVAGQAAPVQVGQLQLTDFVNPAGLQPLGENLLAETAASGPAQTGTPGQNGLGVTHAGFGRSLERQRGRGAREHDRDAARLRDELEGHLDRRPDARIREQPAYETCAIVLTWRSLLLGGCATLQADGGRDFDADLARRRRRCRRRSPAPSTRRARRPALWENVTARNVGDTLTIRLQESTEAEKTATTTATKSSIGGAHRSDDRSAGRSRSTARRSSKARMGNESQFAGNGAAAQSNKLDGFITVTVAKRLSNGNLLVRGQKLIAHQPGPRIRAPAGHRAPERHRAGQLGALVEGGRRVHLVRRLGHGRERQQAGLLFRFFNSPLHAVLRTAPMRRRLHDFARRRICAIALLLAVATAAHAERVKDLATVQGVRNNQLIGYGLVVGLDGTGDQTSQAPFTIQSIKNMLVRFGVTIPAEHQSAAQERRRGHRARRPAAVRQARPDHRRHRLVHRQRQSLRGGSLIMTPLRGADGEVYAIAQGSLVVGGFGVSGKDGSRISVNVPSAGRMPNGATVEREVPTASPPSRIVMLNLHAPDFTTAARLAEGINKLLGDGTAQSVDGVSVKVAAPADAEPAHRLSRRRSKHIEIEPGDAPARVIVNSRTGTVVIGSHVRVMPAAVAHGSLSVTITERAAVSQPNEFGRGETVVVPQSSIVGQAARGAHVRVRRRRRSQRHRARGEPGGRRARRPRRDPRSAEGIRRAARRAHRHLSRCRRIDSAITTRCDATRASTRTTSRQFAALRRGAAANDPTVLREAAKQFESLFTKMMLESMRQASFGDPMFGSDQGDMYQDMMDDQLAVQLSQGKGLGLADMLIRQLSSGAASGAAPQTGHAGRTNVVDDAQQAANSSSRCMPHAAGRGARARRRSARSHRAGRARNRLGHVATRGRDGDEPQPVRHQGRAARGTARASRRDTTEYVAGRRGQSNRARVPRLRDRRGKRRTIMSA